MADDTSNRPSALAAALAGKLSGTTDRQQYVPLPVYPEDDVCAFSTRLMAQANAEKTAREVIYAAVSRWAGVEVEPGGRIPVVRNGQIVEWRGSILTDPASAIIKAAKEVPRTRLEAEQKQLKKLFDAMRMVRRGVEDLDLEFSTTLNRTWRSGERSRGEPLDIVHALGIEQTLNVSLHGAMQNIRQRLSEIEEELRLRPPKKGRPRRRPAYEAAREFAILYAAVTGKRPTCSVSDRMVYGEFAPALRDLFDVFGWKDITGPGEAAVEAITDEHLRAREPSVMGAWGGLLGLPR